MASLDWRITPKDLTCTAFNGKVNKNPTANPQNAFEAKQCFVRQEKLLQQKEIQAQPYNQKGKPLFPILLLWQ